MEEKINYVKKLQQAIEILDEIIKDKNLHPFKMTLNEELAEAKEILINLLDGKK